jgi:hypothetical protein
LNVFQSLFDGLGIFVPGSDSAGRSIQNDETKQQQVVKAVFLQGERLKPYIGYDLDGDGLGDTDLFKDNVNASPAFYTADKFVKLNDGSLEILNGVRLRPRYPNLYGNDEISFW